MPANKIYETLDALPDTGTPNELVYIKDLGQIYTYSEEYGWEQFNQKDISVSGLTKYDINKMVVEKLPELAHKQIKVAKKLIREFVNDCDTNYVMLLCHELRYYTVFTLNAQEQEAIEDVLIEMLCDLGQIKSINYNEDKTAIECWVKRDDGIHMFLLFDYDWGIVPCR